MTAVEFWYGVLYGVYLLGAILDVGTGYLYVKILQSGTGSSVENSITEYLYVTYRLESFPAK